MLTHTQVIPMQTLQFIVAVNPNFCRDWNCIFQVLWDWALVKKWWSWRHGVAIYRNRFINSILSGQDQFCVFQWSCPHLERCYILLNIRGFSGFLPMFAMFFGATCPACWTFPMFAELGTPREQRGSGLCGSCATAQRGPNGRKILHDGRASVCWSKK